MVAYFTLCVYFSCNIAFMCYIHTSTYTGFGLNVFNPSLGSLLLYTTLSYCQSTMLFYIPTANNCNVIIVKNVYNAITATQLNYCRIKIPVYIIRIANV